MKDRFFSEKRPDGRTVSLQSSEAARARFRRRDLNTEFGLKFDTDPDTGTTFVANSLPGARLG